MTTFVRELKVRFWNDLRSEKLLFLEWSIEFGAVVPTGIDDLYSVLYSVVFSS